jgi:hypothetical protein
MIGGCWTSCPLLASLLSSSCGDDPGRSAAVDTTSSAIVGSTSKLDVTEWRDKGRVAEIVAKNPGPAASCALQCRWLTSGC